MIDKEALLAWIKNHADHNFPLVAAIYAGLAERIERGDFDMKEEATDAER